MTDTLMETAYNFFSNIMNAGMTDLIIYAIGFIGFCILGSLLTRKDRKENPEKYPLSAAITSGQDYSMETVIVNGQPRSVIRSGNTTYIG